MSTPLVENPSWTPLLRPNSVGTCGGGATIFFSGRTSRSTNRHLKPPPTDKVTMEHTLSKADEHSLKPQPEHFVQFAKIDEGFWAWHFTLRDSRGKELASISRAFRGFGREIFTDTGQYSVSFNPLPSQAVPEDTTPRKPYVIRELSLQERALVLAMAVNVDFDYFSRHSEGGYVYQIISSSAVLGSHTVRPGMGFWHFGWSSSD
ncbi:Scramblase-domain-containing protein [Lactarius indigo]|nr:Scramblase-domain-containing protein [Lactarius indigo]